MNTSESWIDEALQRFHLRKKVIDDSRFDRFWMMIDRSRLPERMYATCCAINEQSDQGLIYEETFLQPHPVARRYILEKDNRIIFMELVILFEGPGLVFSSHQTRHWVKSIRRYCGYCIGEKNNIVCKLVIDPEAVSDADVQRWFTFLLSGLQYRYKPRQTELSLKET